MTRLEALSKYFYGGQAESEKDLVSEIFVYPDNLGEITDFSTLNYKIVIGPKGSGKSLLLEYINEYYLDRNIISLIIRPRDIDSEAISKKTIETEKTKEAVTQIKKIIAEHIKKSIEANAPEAGLLTQIASAEFRDNLGEFISELLPENYSKVVKAFSKMQKIAMGKKQYDHDISRKLKENNKKFILMLDDLDKIVEEGQPGSIYSTSWAIIEAAIEIANENKDFSVIVVSRTDVWYLMTKVYKHGQSIFDKIQKPYNLYVNDEFIERVFKQRVTLSYEEACENTYPTYAIDYFFEPNSIGFYGRQEIYRPWSQWIAKNTRNRTRDMIQLMQMLIKKTEEEYRQKDAKITDAVLHMILEEYARSRISNIKMEYGKILPKIDDIIYRLKQKRYTFSEMRDFLNSATGIGVFLDNEPIHQNEDKSIFKILRILHMASVINPRIEIPGGEYTHILFEKNQDYINPDNINNLQNVIFEVHPTFHCLIVKTSLVK